MTETDQLHHGVDREQLETFADQAADDPDAVQLTLESCATYEGTCAHSVAEIDSYELGGTVIARDTRRYTIPYGGWREVLEAGGWVGAADRLEPVEVALSSLAACINVGITINAVASGVDIDQLRTTVRTDFDPAVLFSLADLTESEAVIDNLTATVEIDGDGIDKDLVDEWARRAPVYSLVSSPQDIELSIETPAAVPAGD